MICFPLCIFSFWGKFGEKPNKTQTFTVTSPAELYAIIETFRFQDGYDYEYEIFSILSSVRA